MHTKMFCSQCFGTLCSKSASLNCYCGKSTFELIVTNNGLGYVLHEYFQLPCQERENFVLGILFEIQQTQSKELSLIYSTFLSRLLLIEQMYS